MMAPFLSYRHKVLQDSSFFVLYAGKTTMCQNHAELIQKSRHRYERPLFTLAATLTLGVWLILFALSFAKADTVAFL